MIRFNFGPDGKGKLVRDDLDEVIRKQGYGVKSKKLGEKALTHAIIDKFPEELAELRTAVDSGDGEKILGELADNLTLLKSTAKSCGFDFEEVEKVESVKTAKKGAFNEGTFIEYVDLNPDGDDYEFWLNHFRENSDRYIEEEIDDK